MDKFGDLYLEVAEAYMAKEQWAAACKLTTMIVASPSMKEVSVLMLMNIYAEKTD